MTTRGRGSRLRSSQENQQFVSNSLRKPGGEGLNSVNAPSVSNEGSDKIHELTDKLKRLNTCNPNTIDYLDLADTVKTLSHSGDDLKLCADIIMNFGLKNKWNAHVAALLCTHLMDVSVEEVKFRYVLLKKLQNNYSEKDIKYSQLDEFILEVFFLCEMYHHLRLPDGSCYKALARPVFDYFGMLIDGSSEKEIEVVREQISKCFVELKQCDSPGLDEFLKKIRKQIVCESTSVSVKAMLLEMLELMVTDWKPLGSNAQTFYDVLTKPVLKICQ